MFCFFLGGRAWICWIGMYKFVRKVPVTILVFIWSLINTVSNHRFIDVMVFRFHTFYALRNLESNSRAYSVCVRITFIPVGTCYFHSLGCIPPFFLPWLLNIFVHLANRVHVAVQSSRLFWEGMDKQISLRILYSLVPKKGAIMEGNNWIPQGTYAKRLDSWSSFQLFPNFSTRMAWRTWNFEVNMKMAMPVWSWAVLESCCYVAAPLTVSSWRTSCYERDANW